MRDLLRPIMAIAFCLLAFFSGAQQPGPALDAPADPPPPRATLVADTAGGEIGEPIAMRVSLPGEGSFTSVKLKLPPEQSGKFVIPAEVLRDENGVFRFEARALAPGEAPFGPLSITAVAADGSRTSFEADVVALAIADTAAEPAPPNDYTGVLGVGHNWPRLLAFAAFAAAIFAALLWMLVRWWRRRAARPAPQAPPVPALPPIEEARRALHALESLEVFRSKGTKAHYSELSFLLRRYFERQFTMTALEMTEEELIAHVRHALGGHPAAAGLARAFDNASLAKFAKWQAAEDRVREDLATAAGFLNAEDERLRLGALRDGRKEAA